MAFELTEELEMALNEYFDNNCASSEDCFLSETSKLCTDFILSNPNLFPNMIISQPDIEYQIREYFMLQNNLDHG